MPNNNAADVGAIVQKARQEAAHWAARDYPATAALLLSLASHVEALQADKARLDWIEARNAAGEWPCEFANIERSVIDEVMSYG